MKLWSLMESECHILDLELAQHTRGETGDRAGFLAYSATIHKLADLEEEKHRLTEYANVLDSMVTSIALQLEEDDQQYPRLVELRREAVRGWDQLDAVVSQGNACCNACTTIYCPIPRSSWFFPSSPIPLHLLSISHTPGILSWSSHSVLLECCIGEDDSGDKGIMPYCL